MVHSSTDGSLPELAAKLLLAWGGAARTGVSGSVYMRRRRLTGRGTWCPWSCTWAAWGARRWRTPRRPGPAPRRRLQRSAHTSGRSWCTVNRIHAAAAATRISLQRGARQQAVLQQHSAAHTLPCKRQLVQLAGWPRSHRDVARQEDPLAAQHEGSTHWQVASGDWWT
jgi:hypothetical protein